jgi:hypothetical protein
MIGILICEDSFIYKSAMKCALSVLGKGGVGPPDFTLFTQPPHEGQPSRSANAASASTRGKERKRASERGKQGVS